MQFYDIKKNLEKLGYCVSEFNSGKDATMYLSSQIQNMTVGMGGSITLEEMGLFDELAKNNEVCSHLHVPEGMSKLDARKKANLADIYISSVNGIAQTGEIVNIDNTGNRVSAISFGHEKVYLVAGENKITATYEDALYRARNVAAPLNAKRMGLKTPCAINADKCYDCKSPQRICRNLSVLWSKPACGIYEVVLIHENLGY